MKTKIAIIAAAAAITLGASGAANAAVPAAGSLAAKAPAIESLRTAPVQLAHHGWRPHRHRGWRRGFHRGPRGGWRRGWRRGFAPRGWRWGARGWGYYGPRAFPIRHRIMCRNLSYRGFVLGDPFARRMFRRRCL